MYKKRNPRFHMKMVRTRHLIDIGELCIFLDPKKCRARYGLEGINQWCKHCRRKKKCTRFLDDELTSSPSTPQSDTDDILSRQINSIEDDHNDSNEENKHEIHTKSASVPSFFTSSFLY